MARLRPEFKLGFADAVGLGSLTEPILESRAVYSIEGIVAKLKAARKKKGLSQEELGQKIGMPQSHVTKIETGLVYLQPSTLIEIARIGPVIADNR
jgi:DNA-binding XRE family transcriptional regulator